ncbi:Alpha-mannosidase 2, partial [Rhizophlyctis rosea]
MGSTLSCKRSYGSTLPGISESTCSKFDFRNSSIPQITNTTIAHLADSLVQQYKSRSQYYKHSHLLIPLGGDNFYTSSDDAKSQYENYEKLFKFINARSEKWGIKVRWSTLDEYFRSVRGWEEWKRAKEGGKGVLQVFDEDFPNYMDEKGIHWTGYEEKPELVSLIERTSTRLDLVETFTSISLLLGSTRTDLLKSLTDLRHFCKQNASTTDVTSYATTCIKLLNKDVSSLASSHFGRKLNILDLGTDGKLNGTIYMLPNDTAQIGLFNPLSKERRELVEVFVGLDGTAAKDSVDVEVTDAFGKRVVTQLLPDFDEEGHVVDRVVLILDVTLPPVGWAFYNLKLVEVKVEHVKDIPPSWSGVDLSDMRRYQPDSPDIPTFLGRKMVATEIYPNLVRTLFNKHIEVEFTQEGWPANLTYLFHTPSRKIPFQMEPRLYQTLKTSPFPDPRTFYPNQTIDKDTYYYPGCDVHKSWRITGPLVTRIVMHYGECPMPIGIYTLSFVGGEKEKGTLDVRHSVGMNGAWMGREMVWELEVGGPDSGLMLTDAGESPFLVPREGVKLEEGDRIEEAFKHFGSLAVVPGGMEGGKVVIENCEGVRTQIA